jgi:hypothetical protein
MEQNLPSDAHSTDEEILILLLNMKVNTMFTYPYPEPEEFSPHRLKGKY